ncbi:MAG: flavin reductase family protein [Candidatus Hermodarchaeota archaeon]
MSKSQKNKIKVPFDRSFYLLHPYNSSLITSNGTNGEINVMTVAWIIPVSVDPPLVAMSIRPERYSYKLIIERREFVVNIPTIDQVQEVLFCGRKSGKNLDKFQETSLTHQKAKKVNVPIIEECVAHLECEVLKTITLGSHVLIVGQIVEAYASDDCFKDVYNSSKFRPCLHIGKNLFTTCTKEIFKPHLSNH